MPSSASQRRRLVLDDQAACSDDSSDESESSSSSSSHSGNDAASTVDLEVSEGRYSSDITYGNGDFKVVGCHPDTRAILLVGDLPRVEGGDYPKYADASEGSTLLSKINLRNSRRGRGDTDCNGSDVDGRESDASCRSNQRLTRHYAYVITDWRDSFVGWSRLLQRVSIKGEPLLQFCVVGLESGESDNWHLQAYVRFHQQVTFGFVKTCLPTAHIEKAEATAGVNWTYCTKNDIDPFWMGPKPKITQPRRVDKRTHDWDKIYDLACEGGIAAVRQYDAGIAFKHAKIAHTIGLMGHVAKETLDRMPFNVYIVGPSGTGKSHGVRIFHQEHLKPLNNDKRDMYHGLTFGDEKEWWDGYRLEKYLLIDELTEATMRRWKMRSFLTIVDKHSAVREFKGGTVDQNVEGVIITSNTSYQTMFGWASEDHIDAVHRRVPYVIETRSGWEPPIIWRVHLHSNMFNTKETQVRRLCFRFEQCPTQVEVLTVQHALEILFHDWQAGLWPNNEQRPLPDLQADSD